MIKLSLLNKGLFIINVGLNSTMTSVLPEGRKFAPVFDDNRFKFIPIPAMKCSDEKCPNTGQGRSRTVDHYARLSCRGIQGGQNQYRTYADIGLHDHVRFPDLLAHDDPEFITFTFGDYLCKPRCGSLNKLETGDILAFFASFQHYRNINMKQFYFIGFFEVQAIKQLEEKSEDLDDVARNDHVRLTGRDSGTVWKGSQNSVLFERVVPFGKTIARKMITIEFGVKNKQGRLLTDFETINSKTRASRSISAEGRKYFWNEVEKYNPDLSIFREK